MTKRTFSFFIASTVAFLSAMSLNPLQANPWLVDTTRSTIDTTQFSSDDFYANSELTKMLGAIPFNHAYLSWDTVSIHPYHFSLTAMTDTVQLPLAGSEGCSFTSPVMGVVNSPFGWRHGRPHYGIDLDLNTGDTVSAAFDGIVRISNFNSGYGNVVVIRHYNGLETLYGHLSRRDVQVGDHVRAGDKLGLGGTTGRSTGPHLHLEVRYKGEPIDPARVINFGPDSTSHHTLLNDTLAVCSTLFAPTCGLRRTAIVQSHTRSSSVYVIRKGDNLGVIALRQHTSVTRLCQLNHITKTSTLSVGKKLKVR